MCERNIDGLRPTCTTSRDQATIQACALTRNWTGNLKLYSNDAQSTEPHQSGQNYPYFLIAAKSRAKSCFFNPPWDHLTHTHTLSCLFWTHSYWRAPEFSMMCFLPCCHELINPTSFTSWPLAEAHWYHLLKKLSEKLLIKSFKKEKLLDLIIREASE